MKVNYTDFRCGHNFPPNKCPYEICGFRNAILENEILKEGLMKIINFDTTVHGDYTSAGPCHVIARGALTKSSEVPATLPASTTGEPT